jgi:hypothetical protein
LLQQVIWRNMAENAPPVLHFLPGWGYLVAHWPDVARAAPLEWASAQRRRRVGHIACLHIWQRHQFMGKLCPE